MKFSVLDMNCGHCTSSIQGAIGKLDADANLEFDLEAKTVTVASQKSAAEISDTLNLIGFPSTVVES